MNSLKNILHIVLLQVGFYAYSAPIKCINFLQNSPVEARLSGTEASPANQLFRVGQSVNEITAVSRFLKSTPGNKSIVEKVVPYILSLDGGIRSTPGISRGTGLVLIPESYAKVALVVTARHIHSRSLS